MSVKFNASYAKQFIRENDLKGLETQVADAHKTVNEKSGLGNDFLGWVQLPENYDKEEFARIKAAAAKIRRDTDILIVIGIGGSYLGARAAIEFLKGPFYNQLRDGAPSRGLGDVYKRQAVGLLPIAAAGADIDALMSGAAKAMKKFNEADMYKNDCYLYAALRNAFYRKGKSVELLVSYEPRFTMMAEWFKQLFGESEGKDNKGLFPASVTFSTDLHSMGQFIQDGSRLMFETVVTFGESDKDITIEKDADNGDGLNFLAGETMSYVNSKAFEGTVLAHTDGGVPNFEIKVDKPDEENLGELIYFFEKACAISGYMLGVNQFDQPGVESYKKNMFALLGKPGYEDRKAELEARLNG